MSRSLRSRPLTLYDTGDGSQTPGQQHQQHPLPSHQHHYQQQQQQQDYGPSSAGSSSNLLFRKSSKRPQQQLQQPPYAQQQAAVPALSPAPHTQDSGSGDASPNAPGTGRRMSKAIGNNLRKRLSMRYAEPTALGPGGLSAVPQMPALPAQYSAGDPSSSLPAEDAGMAGIGLRAGRGLPPSGSMGDSFRGQSADPTFRSAQLDYGSAQPSDPSAMGYGGAAAGDAVLQYQQQQALHDQHFHQQQYHPHTADMGDSGLPSADRRRDPDSAPRGAGWERLERFARNPAVDLNLLTQSKFDPEAYIRATLTNHSEGALREFQATLESTQAAANSDLRRTIFRNYKDFINISKEVSTLENDMLELKELLAEWRQLPEALQIIDSQTGLPKSRKGSRAHELAEAANAAAQKAAAGSNASNRQGYNSASSRLINELTDDLAVKIALREWESAADLVERGKETLSKFSSSDPAYLDLSSKLSRRISELVAAVSLSLSSPLSKKSTVVTNASIMLRLGQGEKARELFLEARTELLRRRTRMIKFEGDVGLYISELALVYFTLIKNTSEWYMSAFKDNWMASGYVKWAAVQIQAYAEIFRRQVYGVADQDRKVVQEALEITRSSSAQLKEVGLDFGFLIEELLRPAGLERPIPSLTLTLADETMSSAHGHRSSFISNSSAGAVATARPTGTLISAQERRRTIMLAAGSGIPG
ncbi:exocyst complex component exo84 [Tilletia horrida]|nr:exocyst complex component exo84 [Tilletia horrida]